MRRCKGQGEEEGTHIILSLAENFSQSRRLAFRRTDMRTITVISGRCWVCGPFQLLNDLCVSGGTDRAEQGFISISLYIVL